MIWVDYVIVAIIVVSTLISLVKGFIQQVISLVSWLLAFFLALRFGPDLALQLGQYIALEPVRQAVAFFLIFIAVVFVGAIVGIFASKLISAVHLSLGDRLLGLIFGAARGVVIVLTITFFVGISPLVEEPWWNQSMLLSYSRELMVVVLGWMPENFSEILIQRLKSI
ncbi:MAG: colicin V production CvpA [Gammaproteobacteria bacterium]|nr:MAG: colicin V production CvpA [Gammaproteobacteria bacterium]